jgi:hypothetical protein
MSENDVVNHGRNSSTNQAVRYQGTPIFQAISHPVLAKLDSGSIRAFAKARVQYERSITQRRGQEGGTAVVAASIVSSIDDDILSTLCEFDYMGVGKTPKTLTDSDLQRWLDKHASSSQEDMSELDIDELVTKSLRINVREKDAHMRIMRLFADYASLLREHGIYWLIAKNPKKCTKHITNALRPEELKRRIESDVNFKDTSLANEWSRFHHHVISLAVECDKFVPKLTFTPSSQNLQEARKGKSITPSPHSGNGGKASKSSHTPASASSKSNGVMAKSRDPPDCLNPDCMEKHWVKECPRTSSELRLKLLHELSERRKAEGNQRRTRSDAKTAAAASSSAAKAVKSSQFSEGRFPAKFQDSSVMIALPDIGADSNVVPRKLIDELERSGLFVSTRKLETPLRLDLAVKLDGLIVTATTEVQLSVELQLSAGPLRLRHVTWLVAEHDMEEVLLGRPLLDLLGLNAETHLNQVRSKYQDLDCSNVESVVGGGRLARMMILRDSGIPSVTYDKVVPADGSVNHITKNSRPDHASSVTHGDVESDPVEELPLPDFQDVPADDMENALNGMVQDAIANGLSAPGAEKLKQIIVVHRDLWRLTLGADPPASLPPMQLRLEPGARPVRTKLRRYPTEQREFLKTFVTTLLSQKHDHL